MPKTQLSSGQLDRTKRHASETHSKSARPRDKHTPRRQRSSSSHTSTSRDLSPTRGRDFNVLTTHPAGQYRHLEPFSTDASAPNGPRGRRHIKSHQLPPSGTTESTQFHSRSTTTPGIDPSTTHKHNTTRRKQDKDVHISRPKSTRMKRMRSAGNHLRNVKPHVDHMSSTRNAESTFPLRSPIPNTSLDNLLGINATDMYDPNHCVPADQFSRPPRQLCVGPGRPSPYASAQPPCDMNPSLIDPFQRKCLRSLASVILCPNTILPILVGLFNRSKLMDETVYLQTLSEEISLLTSTQSYSAQTSVRPRLPYCVSLVPLCVALLVGYILGLTWSWQVGVAVGITATMLYFLIGFAVLLGRRDKTSRKAKQFADTVSRYLRGCNLLLNILFYRAPPPPTSVQPVRLLPISIDLTASSNALDAMAMMAEKLWLFTEHKYGKVAVRLQWACKDVYADSVQTFRQFCCLPLWLWLVIFLLSALSMATLLALLSLHQAQSPPSISPTSAHQAKEEDAQAERMKHATITCSALCGFSLITLLAAVTPTLIGLFQGRPFQRASERERLKEMGKWATPPGVSCYGLPFGKLDSSTCMNTCGQAGDRITSCITAADGVPGLSVSSDFTSAAAVAAAAAAAAASAAVTATAYTQWHNVQRRGRSGEGAKSGTCPNYDVESQSSCRSDDDNDIYSTSGEIADEEEEEEEDDKEFHKQLQNNTMLFESEEFLIHTRKKKRKKLVDDSKFKDAQNLGKWKKLLRKAFLEACKVLSLIDSRMGGRQTRVIFCVTGAGSTNDSVGSLITLATFVRLIDRLLMIPPEGGTSADVTITPETKIRDDGTPPMTKRPQTMPQAALWTPSVVVLLSATVPYCARPSANQMTSADTSAARDLKAVRKSMFKRSQPWTSFKIWWSIHHVCHLPIYLEDDPPCHQVTQILNLKPAAHNGTGTVDQSFSNVPCGTNLVDMYSRHHELADLNRKRLRQLLTMTAFLGRMINIDHLLAEQHRTLHAPLPPPHHPHHPHHRHHHHGSSSSQTTLSTLVTWLCMIQHWPFHTAWLAQFIEQQFQTSATAAAHSNDTHSHSVGIKVSNVSPSDVSADQLTWETDLSQLHVRVLKRLAPAVEVAKHFALSACLRPTQSGTEGVTKPFTQYPPHVISTLEICDLALRDRDPRRLTEYLRPSESERLNSGEPPDPRVVGLGKPTRTMFDAGRITVSQLIRVMRFTPFLNPQISDWMKELSSVKAIGKTAGTEDKSGTHSATDKSERKSAGSSVSLGRTKVNPAHTAPLKFTPNIVCPVKLKHGMPLKELKNMSVDEVCDLVRNIVDISLNQKHPSNKRRSKTVQRADRHEPLSSSESDTPINDPNPPAPTSVRPSRATISAKKMSPIPNSYERRIRELNITGNVLSICRLSDLQKELGMQFGDWQLFATLIQHLKRVQRRSALECVHTTSSAMHNGAEHSFPTDRVTLREGHLIGTVSDTSLALTVRSAPISVRQHTNAKTKARTVGYDKVKSMNAINTSWTNGQGTEQTLVNPLRYPVYCSRHSLKSPRGNLRYPSPGTFRGEEQKVLYCPKHQKQMMNQFLQASDISHGFTSSQFPRHFDSTESSKLLNTRGKLGHSLKPVNADRLPSIPVSKPYTLPAAARGSRTPPGTHEGMERKNPPRPIRHVNTQSSLHPAQLHTFASETQQQFAFQTALVPPRKKQLSTMQQTTSKPHLTSGVDALSRAMTPVDQPVGRYLPGSEYVDHRADDQIKATVNETSSSTSLAGEMVEEVAELSPVHMQPEPTLSQERGADGLEEHSDHSCDCNYWYALERVAASGRIDFSGYTKRAMVAAPPPPPPAPEEDADACAVFQFDNSLSDSLSTTKSQLDASSGTASGCTSTESSSQHGH